MLGQVVGAFYFFGGNRFWCGFKRKRKGVIKQQFLLGGPRKKRQPSLPSDGPPKNVGVLFGFLS